MLLPPIHTATLNQQQFKWGARVLGRGQLLQRGDSMVLDVA